MHCGSRRARARHRRENDSSQRWSGGATPGIAHKSGIFAVTRCLDCGAGRIADQCLSCGLTSAAAELVLRRRLIIRTAWFLVGALVFVSASQVFPPLDLDLMLIFVGIAFFVGLTLAILIDQRARQRGDVEILKRLFFGLIPLPWIVAMMLLGNGKFDTSPTKRI